MKHRDRILAGTAIGILMAASSMSAHAMPASPAKAKVELKAAPIILAQATDEDPEKKQGETTEEKTGEEPAQATEQPESQTAEPKAEEQAAQPEPKPAEEQAAPEPKAAEEPAQTEPKAAEEPAQAEPKAAEEPAQAEPKAAEEPAQAEPKAAEEPAQAEPKAAEEPAQAEPKAAEEPTQAEPKAAEEPAQAEPKAAEEPAQTEPKAAGEEATQPKAETAGPAQQEPTKAGEEATQPKAKAAEEPAQAEPKAAEEPAQLAPKAAEEPAQQEPKAAGEEATQPKANAAEGEQVKPSGEAATTGEQQPENAAPMLDSQKDAAQPAEGQAQPAGEAPAARNAEQEQQSGQQPATLAKQPESDQAAQRDINVSVEDVQQLNQEDGRRIDQAQFRDFRRRDGARVIEKTDNRTLIQFNNQIIVEDNSHDRIRVDARDVYYEELPNQLRREVVVRPNGSKIITVRNSYGDIVSRTRVVNGQRYVLVYAGEDSYDGQWVDPATYLPPLRIDIPRSEYILEAEEVNDPDRYYQFLDQPPVVPVERLYTIDQVKYSARVRDMVRRVDLDTINFETGSAEITQNEVPELEALAKAIQRMIDDSPAETFLIEGHTDAVGSEQANLILSDKRAESVAAALTQVYDIPPENLFTQGYGEKYLKVETEGPSRENRRVAVRRITPLVSPVASAQK